MRNPNLRQYLDFKEGVDPSDLMFLDPALWTILGFVLGYYAKWGKKLVITSLTEGQHKSLTHCQGRGVDIRIWNIPRNLLEEMVDAINARFAEKFGTGPNGAKPLVAILEKDHVHLQVKVLS